MSFSLSCQFETLSGTQTGPNFALMLIPVIVITSSIDKKQEKWSLTEKNQLGKQQKCASDECYSFQQTNHSVVEKKSQQHFLAE